MVFQARHHWIVQQLQVGFGFNDDLFVEELLKTNNIMDELNLFFRSDGPNKIFFFYQPKSINNIDSSIYNEKNNNVDGGLNMNTNTGTSIHTGRRLSTFSQNKNNNLITNGSITLPHRPNTSQSNSNKFIYQNPNELFITYGDNQPLIGRAVYFFKNYDNETDSFSIDPSISNDGRLSFGIVEESILDSMELLLTNLYIPLLENQEQMEWKDAKLDSQNEFIQAMHTFVNDIHENLKLMTGGLELRKPDKKYLTNYSNFTSESTNHPVSGNESTMNISPGTSSSSHNRSVIDEGTVTHFFGLVQEWCRQTGIFLDENDQNRWETDDSGPDTELEYWKRRCQRLNAIIDQLKTKESKTVLSVLSNVSKHQEINSSTIGMISSGSSVGTNNNVDRQNIIILLKQWKQIEFNISEACNEAKDNVKYLSTLEKFIDPLYTGTPLMVIDSLPGLMNAVKMIHTIARYYNTTERMTKLFMKITNQMILLCKKSILGVLKSPKGSNFVTTTGSISTGSNSRVVDKIWEKNSEILLEEFEIILRLKESYQEQYRLTKDKLLAMPKGKQFDFSESQIFGKFDLFCRRIIKLVDMFSTIYQFKALEDQSLEGMGTLSNTFNNIIKEFRSHKHDILDYNNTKFDRDFIEFNIRISDLESSLQFFINQSFENITSIEQSLNLLKKFQNILQRENLKNDLESKFIIIFHNYGLDLTSVQETYEKYRHNPPICRNLPPVAGNITWSRHLLRRIEEPMRRFESNPSILATKESKKIIKTYNKVARTLVAFEYLWYEAWCKSIEHSKAGLHATLIIRHPESKKLFVNFDREIFQLIREAKCLDRMGGIDIPENAKLIMLQEEKFKNYYIGLTDLLKEYDIIINKIVPITKNLLINHMIDLDNRIRPGIITLTWTSMNIDSYKQNVMNGLQRLQELIININDILENRIEKNLIMITKCILVYLPTDQSFALDDFVKTQEKHVYHMIKLLTDKNNEIETAVEDVLKLITSYNIDPNNHNNNGMIELVSNYEQFRNHYKDLMYCSLLNCTKSSLNAIKKRVYSIGGTGFLFVERPFFDVDVQLSVPSVRLSPSLDDIQRSINRSAVTVLKCSKNLYIWGQSHLNENDIKISYFDKLGCDTEIIKVAILLTGALHGTKNHVYNHLSFFKKYDWLWKEDMENRYNQFMKKNPTIEDFENELEHFMIIETEINQIPPVHNIGALSLNTKNLKLQLRNECRQWKIQYSTKVHQQAKNALYNLMEYIRVTYSKLTQEVDSLDQLRNSMNILKELRERESSIEMEINPILDMYQMLEKYLPLGYMDKEEMDQKSIIRSSWRKLVEYAEQKNDNLAEVQGIFKKKLIKDIKDFQNDIIQFRNDYNNNGPCVINIKPIEAVERLNRFKDELMIRERKIDIYTAGEELFGMRLTEYPEIIKTKKELVLLDQLYNLYINVIKTIEEYRKYLWIDILSSNGTKLDIMIESINQFDLRCKKLPQKLYEWDAYHLLKKEISDLIEILPLLGDLSKKSIKMRHWEEIMKITEIFIPIEENNNNDLRANSLKLSFLLDLNLLKYKDSIQYICESADKQLQIEKKLKDIQELWLNTNFQFIEWNSGNTNVTINQNQNVSNGVTSGVRTMLILKSYSVIVEMLDESQLHLQAMLNMRHVSIFKETIQSKLSLLSDTSDILELWIKVQNLWISLESVFTSGDVSRQMPLESKKFIKIDKDWIKIILKSYEVRNVVTCCTDELIRSTLPILFNELEKCQKSLEGYLEQKRYKFPRFYFVSNPVLLQILSHGSDPTSVQPYYEKIFDSVDIVVYQTPSSISNNNNNNNNNNDKKNSVIRITQIKSLSGMDEEVIHLCTPVIAEGNIEDWLKVLENQIQFTLRNICKDVASECTFDNIEFRDFIDKYPAQFTILGIQFNWTAMCQETLMNTSNNKKNLFNETAKKQSLLLSDLSLWCLTDLKTKLIRQKIETLITIQVHQRDVFNDLAKLYKEKKLLSDPSNDFEWLKQIRFYWKPMSSPSHHLDRSNSTISNSNIGSCIIFICDVDFKYAFEYLGCKERLVITPLTDRCYITLSQALGMFLGGAPSGPAGTGKTETVKDLGRSLGIYVIVTNCTDQQRYTDMAKIFKGLCQAGLWGCFDEFNRIELPVLSVVAQQVLAITNAKKNNVSNFVFPGDSQVIHLNMDVGYFITMNPGYQGRQELPENLKSLFRGVTMMVPDREIIIKVKLCSIGYTKFSELARKFKTLYKLCEEQLSKQRHYDFGLRNILSVLRSAGKIKRDNIDGVEEYLLMKTLRDMNISKLVGQDVPLFLSLLKDLFPSNMNMNPLNNTSKKSVVESKDNSNNLDDFDLQLEEIIKKNQLIPYFSWKIKIKQFYEISLVRHGIMIVGNSGTGKTEILHSVQNILRQQHTPTPYRMIRMNPKAIRVEEMFGETDKLTGEWLEGIFSSLWIKYNDRNRKDITWIVCDGPVDAIWIENLNTVLDDNKILTLANGDRISMTDNCKLIFEVEDLRNASPATVSRSGVIYIGDTDLDWYPVLQGWIFTQKEVYQNIIINIIIKYFGINDSTPLDTLNMNGGPLFNFITRFCNLIIQKSRVGMIMSFFNLFQSLINGSELSESIDDVTFELERLFLFSFIWSIGSNIRYEDKKKLNDYLIKQSGSSLSICFPPLSNHTTNLYDYFVNNITLEWEKWYPENYIYPEDNSKINYFQLIIPTIDSIRLNYVLEKLYKINFPALIIGDAGTSKTTIIKQYLESMNVSHLNYLCIKRINFSYITTPGSFQSIIENELEKRGGKNYGPLNGKRMILFIDDLAIPSLNKWGDQPTLEYLRQIMDTNSFYFLDKDKRGDIKMIEDINYISTMHIPGNGWKNDIPNRLKRHFFILNTNELSQDTIESIYGSILRYKFSFLIESTISNKKNILDIISKLTSATYQLWYYLKKNMLPTPQKFHYLFNLHDFSRIFHGIYRTPIDTNNINSLFIIKLWKNECERCFSDKLITLEEKNIINTQCITIIDSLVLKLTAKDKLDINNGTFIDFLREDIYDSDGVFIEESPKIYEYVHTIDIIKNRIEILLNHYNNENISKKLQLILFDDAIYHIIRICRLLSMNRSSMMLVGIGGSGKRSLCKLACIIKQYEIFQISLSKTYTIHSFLEDYRSLFKKIIQHGKKLVFYFTDIELKDDIFLEYLNSFLLNGDMIQLFSKDEYISMANDLKYSIKNKDTNLNNPTIYNIKINNNNNDLNENMDNNIQFILDNVRDNLHLIFSLSPVNNCFSDICHKYPAILSHCTIDWFLPWPQDALLCVVKSYLNDFSIESENNNNNIKEQLISHIGSTHLIIIKNCEEYYKKTGRNIYQTPRTFLSLLKSYINLYNVKLKEINKNESNIHIGLQKLIKGGQDVEKMKDMLKLQEVKLKETEINANKMLENLEIKSMEAKNEKDIVNKIKEKCENEAKKITIEKEMAQEDLAKAQPYVEEAERAVSSIKPNDLNELKKLVKPSDIIKLIFDCVGILQLNPLVKVEKNSITLGIGKDKKSFDFILDSFSSIKSNMLSDARFLQNIFYFSKYKKDFINDETIELLQPYFELEDFNESVAKNASKAAEGLCCWVKAMAMYHHAAKVVQPKLETLRVAENRLEITLNELNKSQEKLTICQNLLNTLQDNFQFQMLEKVKIEENTFNTKKKMAVATSLINGLSDEKTRWTQESIKFSERKLKLVGDCSIASSFLNYCGPFNKEYREHILTNYIIKDIIDKKIPVSNQLDLAEFLIDKGTISDWSLQSLPADYLSLQNAILVTNSSHYPLLIDPQRQGLNWIMNKEENNLPNFGIVQKNSPKLREQVEYCLTEGKTLIIDSIEGEIEYFLNPLLDKEIINKGKINYVLIQDNLCEINDNFKLYMITKLINPLFSPELQSKTTIIDFTVTQEGLEEQLLAKVIQKEQKSLEEQLNRVQCEVNLNTKALYNLDALLLERLTANNGGNLLDDVELITVLAETKAKAAEVKDKLLVSADIKQGIEEKREQYRPVATRGSILYFSIVDLSLINYMYQTSLEQFLYLFKKSMEISERLTLASKRVSNIIESMTYLVFRFINRGLYEKDKILFLFIITIKILLNANSIDLSDIQFFLKGSSNIQIPIEKELKKKIFTWINPIHYYNIYHLAYEKLFYKNIITDIERNENNWKKWYEDTEPEKLNIPDYENLLASPINNLNSNQNMSFLRLLLIRSLREDRTVLAVQDFIRRTEYIEINSNSLSLSSNIDIIKKTNTLKLPGLGPKYVDPITDTIESVLNDMNQETPVIYLLSPGYDPTESIESISRKRKIGIQCVSMGEGQESVAIRAMNFALTNRTWVLLQNCHLGLHFLNIVEDFLTKLSSNTAHNISNNSLSSNQVTPIISNISSNNNTNLVHAFRLFMTTESHPLFSISLLQKSIKVTNEPPAGLRAGVLRSYTVLLDQDKLDRVDNSNWRILLYSLCFLHSIIQERRKYGTLGWSVPYEFNSSDLNTSIIFLEKHLYSYTNIQSNDTLNNGNTIGISWPTLQYMIAEVQYGGKITDEMDRRLFKTYTELWIRSSTLTQNFTFNPETLVGTIPNDYIYSIPNVLEIEEYHRHINTYPDTDSPEIFGLHPNADINFRIKEVKSFFHTLIDTQLKQYQPQNTQSIPSNTITTSTTNKLSLKDDIVMEKCTELYNKLPTNFILDECIDKINNGLGGFEIPLNNFLYQEIQKLQYVIKIVKNTLMDIQKALRGEIVVTPNHIISINNIYDGRVPIIWKEEFSWLNSTLSLWFTGLIERYTQLNQWLQNGRPIYFWLGGFLNPQGFITAMTQEVTRQHINDKWALDDISIHIEITEFDKIESIKQTSKEGVYLSGFLLEGASWSKINNTLIESEPKKLFINVPIIYMTVIPKNQKKNKINDFGPSGGYECPCYKYPIRTNKYQIFKACLPSKDYHPTHWILRGVALLCSSD